MVYSLSFYFRIEFHFEPIRIFPKYFRIRLRTKKDSSESIQVQYPIRIRIEIFASTSDSVGMEFLLRLRIHSDWYPYIDFILDRI